MRRSDYIMIRLSESEKDKIRELAKKSQKSNSEFIRDLVKETIIRMEMNEKK